MQGLWYGISILKREMKTHCGYAKGSTIQECPLLVCTQLDEI